ncbi:hypothetical protein ABBQ38_002618 [Trebouxia sp. C0009 RCD-2024]
MQAAAAMTATIADTAAACASSSHAEESPTDPAAEGCQAGSSCRVPELAGIGTSDATLTPHADRQQSNDSIFEEAESSPAVEPNSVLGSAQPQRLGSVSTKQRSQLSDETLQAAIREAQAMATNEDISRRKAERRAQKLDKDVAKLHSLLKERDSQAQELQQQLAGAIEADGQQKHSHQHTLTLLDQTHMDQLSKLQAQLRHQSQDDSTRQTKLRLELAEQCELAQQAQCRLTELERERGVLQKKKAEDEAVIKMLLKQQTVKDADRISADTLTPADGLDAESKNTQPQETPLLANPVTPAGTMADRTLVLEADVLRRESRLLKDQLATAKAAVQRLTQARREAELQSSAKLSELEGVLSGLEGKQAGAAALLDDTLLAIQSKTSILLQQRQSGESISPTDAPMSSTQLHVLSRMNEQLASENAALIAELAQVQRRQNRQAIQEGRQRGPALVAGIPAKTLEGFLSLPGTAAAATADQSFPADATTHGEEAEQDGKSANVIEGSASIPWVDTHSILHQRTQQLDAQMELTRLKSENETLKAEAAEAAAEAVNKQGLIHTLRRQLSTADSQHQEEVKQLKRAAKQLERRCEKLAQQLPDKTDDSSVQAAREELAKQKHAWASARKVLQAQQSSLQDECNDLACQLAEQDEQLRCRDERIMQLKKQLQEAGVVVTTRRGSEAAALDVELGSGAYNSSYGGVGAEAAPPER